MVDKCNLLYEGIHIVEEGGWTIVIQKVHVDTMLLHQDEC